MPRTTSSLRDKRFPLGAAIAPSMPEKLESFFRRDRLVDGYAITYGSEPAVKTLLLAWAVLSIVPLTGCAASGASEDDAGDLDAEILGDGNNKHDGALNKDSGSQGQCVTNCTSDMDCQNSCPTVPSGVNCCDTATGVCYAFSSTSCPAPSPTDAGFD